MVGGLFGCLVLSYIVTYFAAWKGLKSTGKMVYVTCLLPYVILTILLIKGLTLEGCGTGLKFLFVPNWEIVGKTETWRAAANQILFSSGVAYGPMMYYGTARQKSDKIVAASFWIPMANSATSIYAALTIFSFLGHVSVVKDIPIAEIATSGPSLLFVAFPSLLALLPGAHFWSIIFFIMCVCLGIDSVFGFFDYYNAMFIEAFPQLAKKIRKEFIVLGITLFSFIWSLMFVMQGGLYNFDLFDRNAGHIHLLVCLFLQAYFIPWHFGMHKISQLMYFRTGQYVPIPYVLIIKIFVMIFSIIIFFIAFINEWDDTSRLNDDKWTQGHIWGGRLIWILPLIAGAVLAFFPLKDQEHIDELVLKQYGIRFDDSKMTFLQKVYGNKCEYIVTDQAVFDQLAHK